MAMQRPSKLPRDINARAAQIVALSTGQPVPNLTGKADVLKLNSEPLSDKNPAAVILGRLGGLKGGKARAQALSKKKRAEIAKRAAAARWKKS
jgi:hypothetical protein